MLEPDPVPSQKGVEEPYLEGVFMFTTAPWKKRFPKGIHFKFGLGTLAAGALVSAIAALATLDYVGVVDSKAAWDSILASVGGEQPTTTTGPGAGEKAATWLNYLVPITALDNLMRKK